MSDVVFLSAAVADDGVELTEVGLVVDAGLGDRLDDQLDGGLGGAGGGHR